MVHTRTTYDSYKCFEFAERPSFDSRPGHSLVVALCFFIVCFGLNSFPSPFLEQLQSGGWWLGRLLSMEWTHLLQYPIIGYLKKGVVPAVELLESN
jgi:antibiotic biosynthesis monooxygenase (ABM) superfamily enzyme